MTINYSDFEQQYKQRQYIGSGGFAQVFKVYDHASGRYVALKIADVRPEYKQFTLKNEVELVNKLPYHANIARYDHCYRFDVGKVQDFAILQYYEEGNLKKFLSNHKLDFKDKKHIIRGILNGIGFLHNQDIIHRDLKSENILIQRESGVWTPKITDFGLSREMSNRDTVTNSSNALSVAYAAPEQIQNHKFIKKNVDLWAAGVVIYYIMTSELPFKGRPGTNGNSIQSQIEISEKITNLILPKELDTIPEPYQSMIRACLVLNPRERVQTAEELIQMMTAAPVYDPPSEEKTIPISSISDQPPYTPKEVRPPFESPYPLPDSGNNIPEYISPKANPTIPLYPTSPLTPPKPEEEPVKEYTPSSGDQQKFKWQWVLIPLLLIGLGVGGFFLYGLIQKQDSNFSTTESTLDKVAKERYETVEDRLIDAATIPDILEELVAELTVLKDEAQEADNYRPYFLLAQAHAMQYRLAEKTIQKELYKNIRRELISAVNIANSAGDQDQILNDYTSALSGSFSLLTKEDKIYVSSLLN